MKSILLFLVLFTGTINSVRAQEDDKDPVKKEQKIQALYVAYITQQLNLNEDEAQKFWPLHKQFDNDLRAIDLNKPELTRQQEILDVKKKYQDRFSRIIGNNRTDDFFRKDTEFRKKLVERLRNIRQQKNIEQKPLNRRRQ